MKLIGQENETLTSLARDLKIPVTLLKECNKHIKDENESIEYEMIVIPAVQQPKKVDFHPFTRLSRLQLPLVKEITTTINVPYTSTICFEDIKKLENHFPFIKKRVIGLSVMGKPIYELRIGNGSKIVHYNAGMHANEWITSMVLMYLVNDYLLNLVWDEKTYELFYETITLSVVPMINPDGVDLSINGPITSMAKQLIEWNEGSSNFSNWKSNINGVDLNDQFPAHWDKEKENGAKSNGPRDYGGEAPLTEPEAIAIANLTKKESFCSVYALHTQGKEIYWGFEGLEPPISKEMAETFSLLSGYKSVPYVNSYAGYKDWFILLTKKTGFTMELGEGENPLPIEQFSSIIKEFRDVFYYSLNFLKKL